MAYRIDQTDALMQRSWENMLWNESQQKDIYSGLVGVYSDKDESLTDSAIMRVPMPKGAKDHTIGLLLDLVGAGRQGGGLNLVGFTEALDLRKFTVYANDVRHGVGTEQYGIYASYNTPYSLLSKVNPLIARWLKARRGKHARQAGLELISDNLEAAPTSLSSGWNANILIKNVAYGSQPAYDTTLATYDAAIQAAMNTVAAVGTSDQVNIQFFTDLEYWITNTWKLKPFDDGSYVVTVPSRQAIPLKRFSTNTTSDLGGFSTHMNMSTIQKYVDAAFGQYLMTIGKLHLIVDDRAPVLDHDVANNTLTAYYHDVGATDNRTARVNTTDANDVYDVGMVFGKSGVIEPMSMKPRYDDDITDFNRLRSVGVATTYGFMATEFDSDTETNSTRIAQNCGVWLAFSGSLTT